MILSGQSIRARHLNRPMIRPFFERTISHGMSFGLGPSGYDVRIAQSLVIEPGGFALASIVEWIDMPDDLAATVMNKSTWVRRGLDAAKTTIVEAGWRGYLTLELSNDGRKTLTIPIKAPIAQIVFFQIDAPVERAYDGKYQNQPAQPTPSIYEEASKLMRKVKQS